MKQLLSLAVAAQIALFTPAKSEALDLGDVLGFALGVGTGILISKLTDNDRHQYNHGFNLCFNSYSCGQRYPINGGYVEFRPGHEVIINQGPYRGQLCRSFDEVAVSRRGRRVVTTKHACFINGQWRIVDVDRRYVRNHRSGWHRRPPIANNRPPLVRPHRPGQMHIMPVPGPGQTQLVPPAVAGPATPQVPIYQAPQQPQVAPLTRPYQGQQNLPMVAR